MSERKTETAMPGRAVTKRRFPVLTAEVTAEGLISLLNRGLRSAAKTRVMRVVELIHKLWATQRLGAEKTDAERRRLLRLISAKGSYMELFDLLSRYWVSPIVMPHQDGFRMAYRTRPGIGRPLTSVDPKEIAAVMCVQHLALRDELDRVRKCDCGKFYFAGRLDQLYCTTKCRVRWHQSSEEFRAKRREYLRNLYHLKKSGKVK